MNFNYLVDFYKLKKKTNVKKSHEFLLSFSEYLAFLHSIMSFNSVRVFMYFRFVCDTKQKEENKLVGTDKVPFLCIFRG